MELGVIKLELEKLIEKVDSIQELFDESNPDVKSKENLDLISKLYSTLKSHLEFLFKDLKKKEAKSELTENEEALWFYAVNEALGELQESKTSKNAFKLADNLYGCELILRNYHSQIDA